MNVFKEFWVSRYERDRNDYPKILDEDPFTFWQQDRRPATGVKQELVAALQIAYAVGTDNAQVIAFLRRACVVAQRAIDEDKLTSPLCVDGFPLNRGTLYRDYTYARAILGEGLDVEALRQSSGDFEEWCKGYGKGEWDSQAQANYLSAIRLAIIVGDLERTRELLKTKKSFKWHKEEHELWKMLTEDGRRQLRENAAFAWRLGSYFARIRDPRFTPDVYMETDVLRLELAAIRDKYIVSEDGTIDWKRAIESVPSPLT